MLWKSLIAGAFATLTPSVAAAIEHSDAVYSTSATAQALVGLSLFALFSILIVEKIHKTLAAGLIVSLLALVDTVSSQKVMDFETAVRDVDWNVIFLLGSMMLIVSVLVETRVFDWITTRMINAAHARPRPLVSILCAATGLFSAFADNVTTVLFMTPMVRRVATTLGISVWAFAMPMIMAANIGGTATLIGDPPNIIVGAGGGLSFMQFIYFLAVPVIFMMIALNSFTFRFYRQEIADCQAHTDDVEKVELAGIRHPRVLRWTLLVVALTLLGFFTSGVTHVPVGMVAFVGSMAVMAGRSYIITRFVDRPFSIESFAKSFERGIEWLTLGFFIFMFMAISSAERTGLIHSAAVALQDVVAWVSITLGLGVSAKLFTAALLILLFSAAFSALVDNIPYTITAVAIVQVLIGDFTAELSVAGEADPQLAANVLWWALSLGACLGGNATMIGASANVTAIDMLAKSGHQISFVDYMKFGVPMATITIAISAVYLALYVFAGAVETNVAGLGLLGILALFGVVRARITRSTAPVAGQ